jgi:hypothetical protein
MSFKTFSSGYGAPGQKPEQPTDKPSNVEQMQPAQPKKAADQKLEPLRKG